MKNPGTFHVLISTERHNVKYTWTSKKKEQDGGRCGLLEKTMYGTQDASALWQDDYTQVLENAIHMKGKASPALFHREPEDCRMLVHQNDFCAVGDQDAMDGFDRVSRQRYELKITGRLTMDNSKLFYLN